MRYSLTDIRVNICDERFNLFIGPGPLERHQGAPRSMQQGAA